MEQRNMSLGLGKDRVFKGESTFNGQLKQLHEFAWTEGFSSITLVDEDTPAKFGQGMFAEATSQGNELYTGEGTLTTAVLVGVLLRSMFQTGGGYPAIDPAEAAPYTTANLLCKEGFIQYKTVYGNTYTPATPNPIAFDTIAINMQLGFSTTDGAPIIATDAQLTAMVAAGTAVRPTVGKVISINPDDESITVKFAV